MELIAEKSDFFFFDIHVCLAPLEETGLFSSSFQWLGAPKTYNERYHTPSKIKGFAVEPIADLEDFAVEPFDEEELESNHFWKHFGKRGPATSPWDRQLPYQFRPAGHSIGFDLDSVKAEVSSFIYLWPWGWSSNLYVSLPRLGGDGLLQAVARQKSGDPTPGTFVVDGVLTKCNQVFRLLGERVKKAVYAKEGASDQVTVVDRQFVLSIPEAAGAVHPYARSRGERQMDASQRADLHSILLGRAVDIRELFEREQAKPRPFLLTEFTGIAFALTDFDRGTLLYLPCLISQGVEKPQSAKHCLAANIRSGTMMALGLAGLLEQLQLLETNNEITRLLGNTARRIILQLSRNNANKFYPGFVTQHHRTSKFL